MAFNTSHFGFLKTKCRPWIANKLCDFYNTFINKPDFNNYDRQMPIYIDKMFASNAK